MREAREVLMKKMYSPNLSPIPSCSLLRSLVEVGGGKGHTGDGRRWRSSVRGGDGRGGVNEEKARSLGQGEEKEELGGKVRGAK